MATTRAPGTRSGRDELESLLVAKGMVARDDDVGRYLRTLFADRYVEQEARLQAAADVTEVFRKSRSSLPQKSIGVNITCEGAPAASALNVTAGKQAMTDIQSENGTSLGQALYFPDLLVRAQAALALGKALPPAAFHARNISLIEPTSGTGSVRAHSRFMLRPEE